ncbi:MAG: hypothetical protein JNM17_33660 [Archangium sp.]|nr:hypothetical protein [Archangium sp.]
MDFLCSTQGCVGDGPTACGSSTLVYGQTRACLYEADGGLVAWREFLNGDWCVSGAIEACRALPAETFQPDLICPGRTCTTGEPSVCDPTVMPFGCAPTWAEQEQSFTCPLGRNRAVTCANEALTDRPDIGRGQRCHYVDGGLVGWSYLSDSSFCSRAYGNVALGCVGTSICDGG